MVANGTDLTCAALDWALVLAAGIAAREFVVLIRGTRGRRRYPPTVSGRATTDSEPPPIGAGRSVVSPRGRTARSESACERREGSGGRVTRLRKTPAQSISSARSVTRRAEPGDASER